MAEGCIFCRIAEGKAPAKVVAERDDLLAFLDRSPQAPEHILIIPKRHIATPGDLGADDAALVGRMVLLAGEVAEERGFSRAGYRLVLNKGSHGGQTVFHLHLHLLGGRYLTWPPG